MSFEEEIAELNEFFFFREFTFSTNTFYPSPTEEVELADNLILLDEIAIAFQIKERNAPPDTTPESEKAWFENQVLKKATRQIRNTINYFKECENIELENNRGHKLIVNPRRETPIHKLIIYKPHELLPDDCRMQKFHRSRTAGLIHIIV